MASDDLALDSHSLRIVLAIAESGSITAAAARLGYSQPALSQHLKRLEARLGMPLLQRVGRSVRLTDAGTVLARHAQSVASALDAAAGEIGELQGLRSGRVRLAAFPSASATIVPHLLAGMAARHPGVRSEYLESEPPEAVAAVREGRVDLALTFSYPGDREDPHTESARGLSVRTLGSEPVQVVLPAGHARAGSDAVDLRHLSGESWIAGCPRCRGHLIELCDASGYAPRIGYETDNFNAVLNMVAAGLGVAMLPRLAVASARVPADVVVLPTAQDDRRTLHLVMAEGAERIPAVRAALAVIGDLDRTLWAAA
ncbi:LysR family transcriptional regulator [Rathayibacter sp. YIM 133350]|uniref:LysR family transcriptional regulator n=1 Tax=Rathayibacter sp. YIM 133350 TaxID=3131992 RepID=UPI00307E5314